MPLDRNEDGSYVRLRPSLLRVAFVEFGVMVVAVAVIFLVEALRGSFEPHVALAMLPLLAIYPLIRVGLVLLMGFEVLILDNGSVFGPSTGGAAQIPVSSLDREGSMRRTWPQRIGGTLVLRSRSGPRIAVIKEHYDPLQLEEFLAAIGLGGGA